MGFYFKVNTNVIITDMKKIPYDKRMHFVAGFVIALITLVVTSFMWWLFETNTLFVALFTTAIPLAAGITKEVKDSRNANNKFDPWDMVATWLGGAIVFIPIWFI